MSWKVDKQKLFQVEYDLCVFQFIGEERELAKAFGAGNMHATLELDKELPQIRNIVDQGDMLDKNNITVRVVVPTQVVQKKTLRFISLPGSQHWGFGVGTNRRPRRGYVFPRNQKDFEASATSYE